MCAYVLCMFLACFLLSPIAEPFPNRAPRDHPGKPEPTGQIHRELLPLCCHFPRYSETVISNNTNGSSGCTQPSHILVLKQTSAETSCHGLAAMLSSFLRDSSDVTKDDDANHHGFDTFNNPVFCIKV